MSKRNENRPGYKETKVGWIPKGWRVSKIKNLNDGIRPAVKAGPFGSLLKKEFYVDSGYKVYGQEQVIRNDPYYGDYFIDEERFQMLKSCEVFPGDILISLVGTLGKVLIVPENAEPGIINPRLLRINLDINNASIHFTKYYLTSERTSRLLHRHSQGGIMGVLNAAIVGAFPIPLPPLPEQKKMAEILSTWDKAIELVDKQIEAKQRLKKGLMQQLLMGKKRFPGFNGEWKDYKIGDIADLTAGGTPSTRIPEYWGGNIRWLKSGDVHQKRIYEVENRITQGGLDNSSAKILPVNSVLIALAGQGKTRGTVAINKVELSTNQSVAAIIPDEKYINFEFLFYNLDFRYDELRKLSTGDGGRGGLNLRLLRSIKVFAPSVDEQKQIVNVLVNIGVEITKLKEKESCLQKQKQGMMQKLLTGEVRVQVNGANNV